LGHYSHGVRQIPLLNESLILLFDFESDNLAFDSTEAQICPTENAKLGRIAFSELCVLLTNPSVIHHNHPRHLTQRRTIIMDNTPIADKRRRHPIFLDPLSRDIYTWMDQGLECCSYTLTKQPVSRDNSHPALYEWLASLPSYRNHSHSRSMLHGGVMDDGINTLKTDDCGGPLTFLIIVAFL